MHRKANNERAELDRLLLLLISRPKLGWASQYEELTRREVERLHVPFSTLELGSDEGGPSEPDDDDGR